MPDRTQALDTVVTHSGEDDGQRPGAEGLGHRVEEEGSGRPEGAVRRSLRKQGRGPFGDAQMLIVGRQVDHSGTQAFPRLRDLDPERRDAVQPVGEPWNKALADMLHHQNGRCEVAGKRGENVLEGRRAAGGGGDGDDPGSLSPVELCLVKRCHRSRLRSLRPRARSPTVDDLDRRHRFDGGDETPGRDLEIGRRRSFGLRHQGERAELEENINGRTTIFGTDFNDALLGKAKEGIYELDRIQGFNKAYHEAGGKKSLSDYYHTRFDTAVMDASLKKSIVFANHNLTSDQVFSEMHLVICRNVLIYFNRDLQERVLKLFADSLVHGGFLCLGTKEDLEFSKLASEFEVVDRKARIYKRVMTQ